MVRPQTSPIGEALFIRRAGYLDPGAHAPAAMSEISDKFRNACEWPVLLARGGRQEWPGNAQNWR